MMTINRHNKSNRRGATLVEFAIAAPVLFMLILAIFEFGWQVVIRHTADNAAYEAARIAIVPGGTSEEATAEANRLMESVGARQFTVSVDPPRIDESTREVEVTVEGDYANNGIVAARFFQGLGFESRSKLLTERPRRD